MEELIEQTIDWYRYITKETLITTTGMDKRQMANKSTHQVLCKRFTCILLMFLFLLGPTALAQQKVLNPVSLPPLNKSESSLPTLDALIYQEASQKPSVKDKGLDTLNYVLNSPVTPDILSSGPIVIPSTYFAYIDKVNQMSDGLLSLKDRFDQRMTTMSDGESTPPQLILSLQELGALTQRLSVDNRRFKMQFERGEDQYQSYQLIEQAVTSLEDAVKYWRLSNRYRSLYRAEAQEKQEDDAFLTLKLETALTAIDALKTIQVMRERLKKLDGNAYP